MYNGTTYNTDVKPTPITPSTNYMRYIYIIIAIIIIAIILITVIYYTMNTKIYKGRGKRVYSPEEFVQY